MKGRLNSCVLHDHSRLSSRQNRNILYLTFDSSHPCCALLPAINVEYFYDHLRIEAMLFEGAIRTKNGFLRPDRSRPGLGLELRRSDVKRFEVFASACNRLELVEGDRSPVNRAGDHRFASLNLRGLWGYATPTPSLQPPRS